MTWKRYMQRAKDPFRLVSEYSAFRKNLPEVEAAARRGDGHPVLVLPPFTCNDLTSRPLRRALDDMGYKTYGWRAGFNFGLRDKKSRHLHDLLKKIYHENNDRKISLIGLSLGGIFARELGREFPDLVRGVISINTPFGVGLCQQATPPLLVTAITVLSDTKFSLKQDGMAERLITPPPVPTTSIYSKTDTVAGWQACLNPKADKAENIEVDGCHIAGYWNHETLAVILDRLSQPEGTWKPFKAQMDHAAQPTRDWKETGAGEKTFFPGR